MRGSDPDCLSAVPRLHPWMPEPPACVPLRLPSGASAHLRPTVSGRRVHGSVCRRWVGCRCTEPAGNGRLSNKPKHVLTSPARTYHPRPADGEPEASSFPLHLRLPARYLASNLLDYKAHRESKPTLLHFWMHVQNHRAVNQTTGLSCSQRDCKAPQFSPPVGGSSAPACPLRFAG